MRTANEKPDATAALRMICALVVVYEHLILVTGIDLPHLPGGRAVEVAVDVFFILSGYWVTRSLESSPSLRVFYTKRCRHILPLYYLTIILTALAGICFTTLTPHEYFTSPGLYRYLGANGIFLNFLHDHLPGVLSGEAVNGSLWTLKIEWAFYFLLPLLMMWMKQAGRSKAAIASEEASGEAVSRKKSGNILIGLFVLCAVLTALTRYLTFRFGFPENINYQIQRDMLFFLCGMFWYVHRGKKLPAEPLFVVLAAAAAVFCIWKWGLWAQILFAPALAILVRAFAEHARPFFAYPRRWDLSYPLYLVHLPIIQFVRSTGLFDERPGAAIALIVGVIALVAGLFHLLERRLFQERTGVPAQGGRLANKT